MNEPITTIDPRYNPPNAVATPWDQTRRVLETADLFWLSTVRADGRPHVTPLVAVWHDGAIYFTTGDDNQKGRNLRGNPHVILTTGYNQRVLPLMVVDNSDFPPNGLTGPFDSPYDRETVPATSFKQRGFVWPFLCCCSY